MSRNKGLIINGGNFTITNMVNGSQVNHYNNRDSNQAAMSSNEGMLQYDVVFSFAGENRSLVKEIAAILEHKKVHVFYDEAEQIDLWGKDLREHFQKVFGSAGLFSVLFLSKHYFQKSWCKYEMEIIEKRASHTDREYVLPIRLDDYQIPSWIEKKGYLDGRDQTPGQIADVIMQKLYLEMKKHHEN